MFNVRRTPERVTFIREKIGVFTHDTYRKAPLFIDAPFLSNKKVFSSNLFYCLILFGCFLWYIFPKNQRFLTHHAYCECWLWLMIVLMIQFLNENSLILFKDLFKYWNIFYSKTNDMFSFLFLCRSTLRSVLPNQKCRRQKGEKWTQIISSSPFLIYSKRWIENLSVCCICRFQCSKNISFGAIMRLIMSTNIIICQDKRGKGS